MRRVSYELCYPYFCRKVSLPLCSSRLLIMGFLSNMPTTRLLYSGELASASAFVASYTVRLAIVCRQKKFSVRCSSSREHVYKLNVRHGINAGQNIMPSTRSVLETTKLEPTAVARTTTRKCAKNFTCRRTILRERLCSEDQL